MQINNNPSFGARRISIEKITKNTIKNGKKLENRWKLLLSN